MEELQDFIGVLNSECDVLKAKGLMHQDQVEPWRYYSAPLDGEHQYELFRAVIESGRHTVEAELLHSEGDVLGAYKALSIAQAALLKSLSHCGKAEAKRIGNATGGKTKSDALHYQIFCIADDLLAQGESERGLARKVSEQLSFQGTHKTENQVREILKKQKHMLVNR